MLYGTTLGTASHVEWTEHTAPLEVCDVEAMRTLSILYVTGLLGNIQKKISLVNRHT